MRSMEFLLHYQQGLDAEHGVPITLSTGTRCGAWSSCYTIITISTKLMLRIEFLLIVHTLNRNSMRCHTIITISKNSMLHIEFLFTMFTSNKNFMRSVKFLLIMYTLPLKSTVYMGNQCGSSISSIKYVYSTILCIFGT